MLLPPLLDATDSPPVIIFVICDSRVDCIYVAFIAYSSLFQSNYESN